MATARNAAEPAELALFLNNELSLSKANDNGNGTDNDNGNGKNNMATNTPRKFVAPAASSSFNKYRSSANNKDKQFNAICMKAQAGQRVMIIMRGPPGSGKSTLAESLLRQCRLLEHNDVLDFVYSTDDYFKSRRGYEYNPTQLPTAHEWNKERVRQKASLGWSPIIVDNTNIMVWEMQPYVQIAVQHGYVLELLEPQTSWSKSASKLAQKNIHQVPRENIQRMLERYEKTSVPDLIKLLKETKYTVKLPQLRQFPPLPAVPTPAPLPENDNPDGLSPNGFKLNINARTWVPYEQGAPAYWSRSGSEQATASSTIDPAEVGTGSYEKSLIELLRDEPAEKAPPPADSSEPKTTLERHCLNCPNEPYNFVLLRQMYPNKLLTGLWDLYVKCKTNVDWAVDILIKEDELNADSGSDFDASMLPEESAQFQCDCGRAEKKEVAPTPPRTPSPTGLVSKPMPKAQRQSRNKRILAPPNKELQLQVENCFVIGDELYSEHTRKIRDIRNGILDQPLVVPHSEVVEAAEEEEDPEDNNLEEMDLGSTLVKQLRTLFHTDGEMMPPEEELPATKVFVPRQLLKQLYMLWLEGVYNQLEEQRQNTLRDDEQFARLLKHPEYAECSESPSNVNELLDMELAWSIYNSEQQAAKQASEMAARQQPNDIATHLTKMKLCEKFPNIPNDTVLEIFSATGSNYGKTVEVLDSNVQSSLNEAELYDKALRESEKVALQEQQQQQKLQQPIKVSENAASQGQRCGSSASTSSRSPQLHEEAKSAALRDFEETRNLAAHHAQLKAECYLKANQAVQKGNGNVALYYSQIANLHKTKIDVFNHRAATCIMEVHKHTQNNPDLLDLHYLHTVEAISCLDLFLDRHITKLRKSTRVYKHVFIITGRGLHSANGVSTIKNKVKSRLGERRLRWQEVNPGLLRVKVFSASRHSDNF
ncbi:NEDD4-binding protein 2 [Drosophila guanche]|uniref:Blast:NEDD4-binding protein 2-like 2 n=1 Tax=Drosophila guanche TaxID=7266 RepID=A0A3B0J909_DROGU|nr:NEDD4-binding protein 2 [Drosophila guanche]XP_034121024.1 NEDD4-binding protein 2 [Drosophila guanche]SPP76392.1 blast:NEDD4-binding protein 2-like 2 [Drosophila guanche]